MEDIVEKAIFFSRIEDLKAYPENNFNSFKYLYFGNEFCENLIPQMDDVALAANLCQDHKMKLVLVTPYVTDRGLGRISPVIERLAQKDESFEVVFNDWGVLDLCLDMSVRHIAMGRLLNKLKRDPRIPALADKFSGEMYEYLKTSGTFSSSFMLVLKNNNIERIEFDNVLQGINMERKPDTGIKYSLYYPYLYFTTSRTCENNMAYTKGICDEKVRCKADCRQKAKRLKMEGVENELCLVGRTFFLKNEALDEKYTEHFDRLILQELIPH